MVTLRRTDEVNKDKLTTILFNLSDTLNKKGWKTSYSEPKGILVNFSLSEADPHKSKEGKAWLKENEGKDFIFKGSELSGHFNWNITVKNSKLFLVTSNVVVGRDSDLLVLQKKLKAKTDKGKLTGRSVKVFKTPDPVQLPSTFGATLVSYLNRFFSSIITDIALALSEIIELPKTESYCLESGEDSKYYLLSGDLVPEGYIVWEDVVGDHLGYSTKEDAIADLSSISSRIVGLTEPVPDSIDDEEFVDLLDEGRIEVEIIRPRSFTHHIEYDEDYNRISESFCLESSSKITWNSKSVQDKVESEIEGLKVDKENTTDKELIFTYNGKRGSLHLQGYMLVLDLDTEDNIPPTNYPVKDRTNLTVDNLLDSVKVVFNRRGKKEESFNIEEPQLNPVLSGVAVDRLRDSLAKSIILVENSNRTYKDYSPEEVIWAYLSPSYSVNPVTDIEIPIVIKDNAVFIPLGEIPSYELVFLSEEPSLEGYKEAIQNYILEDVPLSQYSMLGLDNSDYIRASIIGAINGIAEEYLNNRKELEQHLEYPEEKILEESRYFLVPEDSVIPDNVNPINKIGFTDLSVAKEELARLIESGQYQGSLKILDTHYSDNKEKWEII